MRLVKSDKTLLPKIVKLAYFHFQSNAKQSNTHTLTHIAFLRSAMCELLNVDVAVSYQVAFMSVRYLAIQLRNAHAIKTKETRKVSES